jgi:hypothetical protein
MAVVFPLPIENKVDHPSLVAMVQAFGSMYFLNAEEFMMLRDGLNELHATFQENAGLVNDASPTERGILKLAGDLAGTADAPTVPNKLNKPQLPAELALISYGPDGQTGTLVAKEFDIFDDTITEYATINELVTIGGYSQDNGYTKGTRVICGKLQPPVIYHKYDNTDTAWIKVQAAAIPQG